MMIENHFKQNFKELSWQTFRDRELWTLDVNDVFMVNLHSLQKLWQSFHKFDKGWMDLNDVKHLLFTAIPDFKVPHKTIIKCFGMSKMTNENAGYSRAKETRLLFVEFLEFIGRLAVDYWRIMEYEEYPLSNKIEFILDQILPVVGATRNPVIQQVMSESESDDDY